MAELSELLGLTITDVHQLPVLHGDLRQRQPNAWQLAIQRLSGPWWTDPFRSEQLRSPYWLNGLARRWGRSPDASELTKADGRRLLRLLHEITEAKAASGLHINPTHMKEND